MHIKVSDDVVVGPGWLQAPAWVDEERYVSGPQLPKDWDEMRARLLAAEIANHNLEVRYNEVKFTLDALLVEYNTPWWRKLERWLRSLLR